MADRNVSSCIVTYEYRLLPTKRQHRDLEQILEEQRQLYNAALLERIARYAKTGKGRTYYDQCEALTVWRHADDLASRLPPNLQRWTLFRVDQAFKAFFRRLDERSGKAGYPRFRGKGRWASFGFHEFSGIRLAGTRIRFRGMTSGIRIHMHRPLPEGKPLSCVFRQVGGHWYIFVQMRVQFEPERSLERHIGIDLGLSNLAILSDGTFVRNPRFAKNAEKEMRRRQRALSRCKLKSKRRAKVRARVAALHRKLANSRATYLHQLSSDLVERFDLIATEKLNVKGLARSRLARSVHDVNWGLFRQMIAYKAAKAGARFIEVDPRNTSQMCSGCGEIVPKSLTVRVHECEKCGAVLDRDHNAALNILHLAIAGQGAHNVIRCDVRALGNLTLDGSLK